jgi:hypothetical protein
MNRQKWTMLSIVLFMVGGAAFCLRGWGQHQRLGQPGILARPIPGSILMDIQLPEFVLDYTSTVMAQSDVVTNMLPKDTSLLTRQYQAPDPFQPGRPDHFFVALNAVMMGKDRTSIHKPEYCLPGQGWEIVKREPLTIAMAGPPAYELPATQWTLKKMYTDPNGHTFPIEGFYVFWFSAENKLTGSHSERLWWMWRDLLKTGVLDRWSYISYYTAFLPENEASAAEHMKQFVAASAPQFQLPPRPNDQTVAAK